MDSRTCLFLCLLLACMLGASAASVAAEAPDIAAIPPSDGPLEVWISFSLINITAVDEKEETIQFDGMIHMSWWDRRLAYDPSEYGIADDEYTPGDYSKAPRRIYLTDFAVKELFPGWWPSVTIPNGIGDRNTTNVALGVWPDGRVGYAETFDATVEVPMRLRKFPFDKQALDVFVHPFVYKRHELVLLPKDHLARTWIQNMGIAEWTRNELQMKERPIEIVHFDGSKTEISEFVVTIDIDRQPTHILISVVFPLVLLVCLTFCVFWMDEEGLSDRINIQFIGILSVVAYYFVVLDSVPEIDYLTLMDAFVILSFLLPAAGVVVSLAVDRLNKRDRRRLAKTIDRTCRWAFPLAYIGISYGLGVVFLS